MKKKGLPGFVRFLARIWQSTRLGPECLRVEPVISTIIVLSMLLTIGSTWRGLDSQRVGTEAAEALRSAHIRMDQSITQAHTDGRISGFDRQVALERLDRMTPLFQQYADLIEQKAFAMGDEALLTGLADSVMALSPGAAAGKLLGLLAAGQAVDAVYNIVSLQNSLEGFLQSDPFQGEADELQKKINEIFGLDADALFRARMHHKITKLSYILDEIRSEYPDDPEQVDRVFRWKADPHVSLWADNPRIYGEGERWATYEEFLDWMMQRAVEASDDRKKGWFEREWARIENRLVAERRNCQKSAIAQFRECLFSQFEAGIPQSEAVLACQSMYDLIPRNDGGGTVTTFGEVLWGGTVANTVTINYPSSGGGADGNIYYQLYSETYQCTITNSADIVGSYDLKTCTMRGTANLQILYEGGICVDVCGPSDASPAACPVSLTGSTTWQATLEDGVLRGAVGDESCSPHCFGFRAP